MKALQFNKVITSVITIMAFATVLYTSCTKPKEKGTYVDEQCVNVNCNNGECFKGQCGCYAGWEGYNCDIKVVNKYMGKWTAIEEVTYSNHAPNIGDTLSYDFYITENNGSVTTFKLSGLNNRPNDTIICTIADPISHTYNPLGFYFMNYPSATTQDMLYTRGGGRITSSASFMDTLAYSRWYGLPNNTSFVAKDTVRIVAQKAP